MVGYLLEYLVAFALVANYSDKTVANRIKVFQDLPYLYFQYGEANEVCFPDHMCGPDIIYKCTKKNTVYIVQVKFVKEMSKQEAANACGTTDHKLFYCKRKGNGVLKGFEDKRTKLRESIIQLQREGYSLQQLLFIHTGGNRCDFTRGATIINSVNNPDFFDNIGPGIWKFLDTVRDKFQ